MNYPKTLSECTDSQKRKLAQLVNKYTYRNGKTHSCLESGSKTRSRVQQQNILDQLNKQNWKCAMSGANIVLETNQNNTACYRMIDPELAFEENNFKMVTPAYRTRYSSESKESNTETPDVQPESLTVEEVISNTQTSTNDVSGITISKNGITVECTLRQASAIIKELNNI